MNIEAVDLFCGAGGLTAGLRQAGIKVKAGYDIEEDCRYAYEHNNEGSRFIEKDVQKLQAADLVKHYSKNAIRLLAGCAPCQPFSTYNQGKDTKSHDKRWPLLYAFARLIREIKPELVTMENVPDVIRHQVYHEFVQELEKLGYNIWANTVHCVDYGVPQMRRRHVLLASRIGKVALIAPTHQNKPITVREAVGHLPALVSGGQDSKDVLHRCTQLSDLNMQRIRASKQGGTWQDWPEHLRAKCHQKKSGQTYRNIYGRMQWDKPAPTMTTLCIGYGNGRFGHPEQDRAISLREAAIFQSFPQDYQFVEPNKPLATGKVARMIGNAVPVRLGEVIGKSFQGLRDNHQSL